GCDSGLPHCYSRSAQLSPDQGAGRRSLVAGAFLRAARLKPRATKILGQSQSKSALEWIVVLDEKRVLAGNPGRTFDLGHDCRILADAGTSGHAAAEPRSDEALVDERLVGRQQAHRIDD